MRIDLLRGAASALALALPALLVACEADGAASPDDDPLPAEPGALADNACRALAPVHSLPVCDGCVRDVCCDAVLACDGDDACNKLLYCYARCDRGDRACTSACDTDDEAGPSLLGAVNDCAERSCPVACRTAHIQE